MRLSELFTYTWIDLVVIGALGNLYFCCEHFGWNSLWSFSALLLLMPTCYFDGVYTEKERNEKSESERKTLS